VADRPLEAVAVLQVGDLLIPSLRGKAAEVRPGDEALVALQGERGLVGHPLRLSLVLARVAVVHEEHSERARASRHEAVRPVGCDVHVRDRANRRHEP
jgi:hypothetical protein